DTALSRSENAVMMMTGKPGCFSLTLLSRSRPEPPGMRMSLTRTCGPSSSACIACMTSRAFVKLRDGSSSRSNAFSSTNRMDWSSSTIQMGFMRLRACRPRWAAPSSGQRDHDLEHGPARFAVAFDQSQVLLDIGLRQREPETRTAFAPRYQRVED